MAEFNFGQMRQDALIVPTGDFTVRCVKADAVKNSNGDDMIKVQLEVIAGPYTGRKFSNNFNIIPSNPNALAMFFRQMEAFGLDEAYFNTIPNGPAGVARITLDLVGRVVDVNVGIRKWNDVDQPDIKSIKKAPAQLGGVAGASSGAQALPTVTTLPGDASATTVQGSAAVNLPLTDPDDLPATPVTTGGTATATTDVKPTEPEPELSF